MSYKETLDKLTLEQVLEIEEHINKNLSEFLAELRGEVLSLYPCLSKGYVEKVIDDTLEESAEWEW